MDDARKESLSRGLVTSEARRTSWNGHQMLGPGQYEDIGVVVVREALFHFPSYASHIE
jgi:hypothetical protein